ncbi:MAG: signal recognition particle-docking protein FtsY [Treponema sp.]|nr:signal recognition particle-docking protein FtsY [Treponema sp.]
MKFSDKIKNFFSGKNILDNEVFDDLCDLLIEGDFGASQAYQMAEMLKMRCKNNVNEDMPQILSSLLEDELNKAKPADISISDKFTAILILGVNGVGKTTTAAKLSYLYKTSYNKKIILAAADTFRAAAIDQLKIHGQKLDVRVVAHKQGGDPAAVVYDALDAALSSGADVIIADTAGRMHTKSALVEELCKIDRVVESKAGGARYLKYLVLDATTGRNAFAQAEIFNSAVALDGVILTKYDSTAKGGVVFSLASELKLPVTYICTGEKYTDMEKFDNKKFAREFAGIA